eukprot:8542113-Prorocentrum_lima.AAC.1
MNGSCVQDVEPVVDAPDPPLPRGLSMFSSAEALRGRLRTLKAPTWGTKAQMWEPLLAFERLANREQLAQAAMSFIKHPEKEHVATPVTIPEMPLDDEEIRVHNLTHIPAKP